jgi:hypothetical protein
MTPEQFTELIQLLRRVLLLLVIANAILINLWQPEASKRTFVARLVMQFFFAAVAGTVMVLS